MTCEFAKHDGAYVLGALSPAERQAFENHLNQCRDCARAVRRLAGLPGLLARVDPAIIEDPPTDEPLPATLLPALVHQARRSRRRRLYATLGAAAAAVVIAAGAATVVIANSSDKPTAGPTSSATVTAQHPMGKVGVGPLKASLGFASVAWGTRLDLTCSYAKSGEWGPSQSMRYSLVVRTRDGQEQQVATWRGVPGKTITLTAATDSRRQDIGSVEVRTASGTTVLRLST